jgi:hypothetical protein
VQYQPKPLAVEDVARALLDPSAPALDPAIQLIQVAMSGFGYNFYDARNVARANDQLVRGRANDVLGGAAAALGKLEKAYQQAAFPEATREQPLPPPEVMRRIRTIDGLRKRIEALASALCAAETPATDSIWFRFRDEHTLLFALVACDVALATGADRVAAQAAGLEPSNVGDAAFAPLESELDALERAFAKRRDVLRGGVAPPGSAGGALQPRG